MLQAARRQLMVLWLCTLTCIPVLSIRGRSLQNWAAETLGYTLVAWMIGFIIFLLIIVYLLYLYRESVSIPWLHLVWVLLLFLALPLLLDRVEERLHFLTFGLFGALSILIYSPKLAVLLCISISMGDELLQYFLSDRVGDWWDVAMNSLASLGAALFISLTISLNKYPQK